ncbi:MAG: hypothetical protein IKR48_04110 [Kiritimatiellae bacterium]|nr:hypothetical protein [Kiritimatiellia bacterium]
MTGNAINQKSHAGTPHARGQFRNPMKALAFAVIVALVSAHASFADPNFILGTYTYNCYVVDWMGTLIDDTSSSVALYAYKIVDDGNGGQTLGALLQSSYVRLSPASHGCNCQLSINISSSPSDTTAMLDEQLALVVKKGSKELWRSYTVLPPIPEAMGFGDVGGIVGDTDANGDCISDEFADALRTYGFSYGGAGEDSDGDGVSNLIEYYAYTDPVGGAMGGCNTLTLKDWSVDENNKATVKIVWSSYCNYSIRYTTDPSWRGLTTAKAIKFSKTANGAENTSRIGDFSNDYFDQTQQVWFTLPDLSEDCYIGIAVDGVLCAYTKIEAKKSGYPAWAESNGINGTYDEEDAGGIANVFRYAFNKPTGDFILLDIKFNNDDKAVIITPPLVNSDGFVFTIIASDNLDGTGNVATYPLDPSGETLIDEEKHSARFFRLWATEAK